MKNKESCFRFNRWKYNFFYYFDFSIYLLTALHFTTSNTYIFLICERKNKVLAFIFFDRAYSNNTIQYNTIQLFYCFISFHMRHSQNTFINMFNRNAKNDISFSIMLNKRSIFKKKISILLCRTGFICWMQKFCYFFNCRTTGIQKVDKLIFII